MSFKKIYKLEYKLQIKYNVITKYYLPRCKMTSGAMYAGVPQRVYVLPPEVILAVSISYGKTKTRLI